MKIEKRKNYCLNFWLSYPSNMGPGKYFSSHNLKNMGKKQKVGYARQYVIWTRIITLSTAFYLKVDLKKVVNDFDLSCWLPFG